MRKFIKFTNVKVYTTVDRVSGVSYDEFIVDADKIESLTSYNGLYLCIANLSFMKQIGSETQTVTGRLDIFLSQHDYESVKKELLWTIPEVDDFPRVEVVPCATHEPMDSEDITANLRVDECERDLIVRALNMCGGRRKEAAARLGFCERTLYRKMKEYNL